MAFRTGPRLVRVRTRPRETESLLPLVKRQSEIEQFKGSERYGHKARPYIEANRNRVQARSYTNTGSASLAA